MVMGLVIAAVISIFFVYVFIGAILAWKKVQDEDSPQLFSMSVYNRVGE